MQVSHRLAAESVAFDEDNLVSCAGLVPVIGCDSLTWPRVGG